MTKPNFNNSPTGIGTGSGKSGASGGALNPTLSSGALNRESAVQEIVRVLNSIFQEVDVFSRKSLRKFGVTGPQLWALRAIDSQENLTMGALARRLYLHPSTVSGIVDRLEAHRYVTRTRPAEDARSYTLALTKMAKCVLQTAPEPPRSKVTKGLESLNEGDLRGVLHAIRVLGSIMQVPENEAGVS